MTPTSLRITVMAEPHKGISIRNIDEQAISWIDRITTGDADKLCDLLQLARKHMSKHFLDPEIPGGLPIGRWVMETIGTKRGPQ